MYGFENAGKLICIGAGGGSILASSLGIYELVNWNTVRDYFKSQNISVLSADKYLGLRERYHAHMRVYGDDDKVVHVGARRQFRINPLLIVSWCLSELERSYKKADIRWARFWCTSRGNLEEEGSKKDSFSDADYDGLMGKLKEDKHRKEKRFLESLNVEGNRKNSAVDKWCKCMRKLVSNDSNSEIKEIVKGSCMKTQ